MATDDKTALPTGLGIRTPHGYTDITAEDAHRHLDRFTLVDVREPEEFVGELGHIPGALLVPVGTVASRREAFPTDRPVLLICRSGARSGRAAAWLHQVQGGDYYNLAGGMLSWNDANLPVTREPDA